MSLCCWRRGQRGWARSSPLLPLSLPSRGSLASLRCAAYPLEGEGEEEREEEREEGEKREEGEEGEKEKEKEEEEGEEDSKQLKIGRWEGVRRGYC